MSLVIETVTIRHSRQSSNRAASRHWQSIGASHRIVASLPQARTQFALCVCTRIFACIIPREVSVHATTRRPPLPPTHRRCRPLPPHRNMAGGNSRGRSAYIFAAKRCAGEQHLAGGVFVVVSACVRVCTCVHLIILCARCGWRVRSRGASLEHYS